MGIFDAPIALDPVAGGGCCIADTDLNPADIIVSTTKANISRGIRIGTRAKVSHSALYAGSGSVIEAIGQGVVSRSVDLALADDVLAVAYRSPDMTPEIADRIVLFASSKIGAPYSIRGALMSTDKVMCRIVGSKPATFFCSQLVMEAYKQGGRPLSSSPSQCVTPDDLVTIARNKLAYVGHLLGNPSWFPVIAPN
jgi:cell wall-associated NlpC family hydrolase